MRVAFVVLILFCVTGCGVAYRNAAEEFIRTQPASAWGSAPPPGHKDIEREWIRARLKDPMSAQFKDGENQRVTIAASLADPSVVAAWASTIFVNAKNSFGGYTGFKIYNFYYANGELYAVESEENGRSYLRAKREE